MPAPVERRAPGNADGKRHLHRQVEEGRRAAGKAQRRGVHVAIGKGGRLVDAGLLQRRGAGGTERDDEVGELVLSFQPAERARQLHGRLDRADPGHEGRDVGLQVRAVLGIDGHDVEDAVRADGLEGKAHPAMSSRPRTTIIVPVIEAISLAGPSEMA